MLPIESRLKFEHSLTGLTEAEVLVSRRHDGANVLKEARFNVFSLLVRQFTGNPLLIVLVSATIVSRLLGDATSSNYILWMIGISIVLGFWNEYSAERVIQSLMDKVTNTVTVLRDSKKRDILSKDVVVGDIVFVGSGNIVPADIVPLESKNLELNESVLTGESIPVFKTVQPIFMGTIVLGGWCKGYVEKVGKNTAFGKIAEDVSFIKPSTNFQKGLQKFGNLLVKVILLLTVVIFLVNFLLGREVLASLLFSLAIAVGLTPELLPVIVTISLARGAGILSKKHVIAKQLVSLENLGNMDVLCTDKTGTLTEGKIELVEITAHSTIDTLEYALICNSAIVEHKVIGNPIDTAIWEYAHHKNIRLTGGITKLEDKPFDYETKGAYTVFEHAGVVNISVKGAPEEILSRCHGNNSVHQARFMKLSSEGYRVIAVAHKKLEKKADYSWDDAKNLTFAGFLSFMDTPKRSSKEALARLAKLSVLVKVLTGDNELITKKICTEVGLKEQIVYLGTALEAMTSDEFAKAVELGTIFARVSPEQKQKVIAQLKANGHTVGFLGDGVNDIPSLHSADVGISVNTAIDVAKNAANIVILRKNLDVIAEGIIEGRKTFNNTIKYILMGTSSNFGNMFSAAAASFVLPFLPMTPAQILLNNSLYDASQMSLPTDNVDEESLKRPKHWDIRFIKNYMIFFGPISSVYDFITYALMYYVFRAQPALFQAGWFIESLATQVLVVFVIRTSRSPFYKSKPGKWLLATCISVVAIATLVPFTAFGHSIGFMSPPPLYFACLVVIVVTYLWLVEVLKKKFLQKFSM